jgi:hypothetical protein
MFEGLVNLLPILKGLAHTSPNVELPEIKQKKNKILKCAENDSGNKIEIKT